MWRRLALTAAGLLLAGCGGAGYLRTADSVPVHDTARLAEHETPEIGELMVDVPGYTFVEVGPDELAEEIAHFHRWETDSGLHDGVPGMSFHAVVADDASMNVTHATTGDEVGFMIVLEFVTDVPRADSAVLLERMEGQPATDHLTIAGHEVSVFNVPEQPQSAWAFDWTVGPVVFRIDGAQRAPIEQWLAAYLPLISA